MHTGEVKTASPIVRQSISLPTKLAAQVRTMAKMRKLSANRMMLELIENGLEADRRRQQEFVDLAEHFRNEKDPEIAKRLGDQLGRMIFGA